MLIIENGYKLKCSLGSLVNTAHQTLSNILESSILILKSTLLVNVKLQVHLIRTVYIHATSLGALVPNSRDRHEKQWRPDFTHHKTHPKIRFV